MVVVTALTRTTRSSQSFPCKSNWKTAQKTLEHPPSVSLCFQIPPLGNEDSMSITNPISEICRGCNFLVSPSFKVFHSFFSSRVFTPLPSSIVESYFSGVCFPLKLCTVLPKKASGIWMLSQPGLPSYPPCQHYFLLCIPASEVQTKMLIFFVLFSSLLCILAVS